MNGSPALSINKEEVKKNGKIWLIGVAALTVTFLANSLPAFDFGNFTPVVAIIATGLIDLARRYIADNT